MIWLVTDEAAQRVKNLREDLHSFLQLTEENSHSDQMTQQTQ